MPTPSKRHSYPPVSFFSEVKHSTLEKYFRHVQYACIHWAAGCPVRIGLLLMTIMKRVDHANPLKCTEDTQCKLNTVIPVLKRLVNLILEVSYPLIVIMINMINGKILTLV